MYLTIWRLKWAPTPLQPYQGGSIFQYSKTHLVGSVLDLPRNPLHRVAAIGARDLQDKLVVAPRSADVHIHLQSIVRADGREEVWPCLRTVIPPVHALLRDGRPGPVLHASFEPGGAVCQGKATLVGNLPAFTKKTQKVLDVSISAAIFYTVATIKGATEHLCAAYRSRISRCCMSCVSLLPPFFYFAEGHLLVSSTSAISDAILVAMTESQLPKSCACQDCT